MVVVLGIVGVDMVCEVGGGIGGFVEGAKRVGASVGILWMGCVDMVVVCGDGDEE